jgi:hypothetical protein
VVRVTDPFGRNLGFLTGPGDDKAKLSLGLTKHYAMKTCKGVDEQIQVTLTSTIVEGEWSASDPSRGKRSPPPGTHWKGGWVGPRAGLDDMEK